jgi:anthranilate synthase component I
VIEPWTEFARAAAREEMAGYFEAAPRSPAGAGTASWFAGRAELRTVDRATDPIALAQEADRFLSGGRARAVMGYLSFDAVGLLEPALARFPAGSPFPLGELAFVERGAFRSTPFRPPRYDPEVPVAGTRPRADSLPKPRFERAVRRLVEEISAGEAFQVVLAHRRAWTRPPDLLERAGLLRRSERYSFFYYLKFGDRELAGATPESVVEIAGRSARINPIAGTIPFGRSRRGRTPLTADRKELAEHRMLVDLARNDLGRVAEAGSVRLEVAERRERFAALEHLVSQVGARLPRGTRTWSVLAAAFPAGTVSGAPKIRATELLRREEGTWRGPYAGAVGLVRPGQIAQWALAIRSGFAAGNRLYTAAGAGIVHRSRPAREYAETLSKLARVEATLVGGLP